MTAVYFGDIKNNFEVGCKRKTLVFLCRDGGNGEMMCLDDHLGSVSFSKLAGISMQGSARFGGFAIIASAILVPASRKCHSIA